LNGTSDWLRTEAEVVSGIPQEVLKLALRDDESKRITGVAPSGLINRVILGPTAHPVPIGRALTSALVAAGVPDPGLKIWASNIPLRQ
jgi:hypothetical protein